MAAALCVVYVGSVTRPNCKNAHGVDRRAGSLPHLVRQRARLDKEAGPDVEMLYFNSDMDALNPLPAGRGSSAAWGYSRHDRRTALQHLRHCQQQ